MTTTLNKVNERRGRLDEVYEARALQEIGFMTASLLHEMRQPMFAMKALVQLMQVQPTVDQLGMLSDQVEHVTDLLDFYGGHGGERPPAVFDVNNEVERAARLFRHLARSRKITLDVQLHSQALHLLGRATSVRQILVNLLRNSMDAVQHQVDGRVLISTGPGPTLRVSDNGPGVDHAVQDSIFDAWVTTKSDGTGLGLWISHELAANLGAELVLATSDQGAAFELRWVAE